MSKPQTNDLFSHWGQGASASSSTNAGAPPPSIPGSAPSARARAGALTDGGASLVDAAAAAARTSARSSARPDASTPHGALAPAASTSARLRRAVQSALLDNK
ncbi:hypothetical protein THAOC_23472 [Thalassiosira oceanica]|uniref:Uncharacterized protein n=1 Tax=Thalassiosira oceanica TaxID=159749 RepID=K0SD93_THAOC|nr:hypothetical protein THAOC_23472 [Thalassiosira oceanica]|eukprot:EJK56607.1 hypothetical protein THAOC_23472 [Thalassiosira oceanica]